MKKQRTISRAGRLTALFLTVVLIAGYGPISARAAGGGAHFTDVPSSHWAFQYVERAYQDGAIVGTAGDPAVGTGVFSPNTQMTYGQFLTMLTKAFYPEELAKVSKDGPWYAPAMRVAVNRGLTFNTLDDLMNLAPYAINRYNMAWILVKLLDDKCVVLPNDQDRAAAAAKIGDWQTVVADKHWEYFVSSIYAFGIITGVDDAGTFDGTASVTRASAAAIYARIADKIQTGGNDPKAFQVTFDGQWDGVVPAGVQEALEEEFYTVYPRLWARWGSARVSKHISVRPVPGSEIDNNAAVTSHEYDYMRYQCAPIIKISIEDINNRPNNRATFAHELTHASTSAMVWGIDGEKSVWLVECLADYGAFRYAAWAEEEYFTTRYYYQAEEDVLRTWRYKAYGESPWFFAYMDEKYPTTKTGRGLVDSIVLAIENGQVKTDGGTAQNDAALNALVKEMTGYNSLEALRQKYVQELDAKTWTFDGFSGFADNCFTEGLPGVTDPTYPTNREVNLTAGSYTYKTSGQASNELEANNLVDGNHSTKWEASSSDVEKPGELGQGIQHRIAVSLGRPVTFNSYTLYHEGSQGDSKKNTSDWRLYYYDEQKKEWILFDEVQGNTQDVTTRSVKPVTTQHVWLDILKSNGSGDGTVRLYELELYNTK